MDTTGLIVVATVLVLGTAVGLWRRHADGRFHSVAAPAGGGPVSAAPTGVGLGGSAGLSGGSAVSDGGGSGSGGLAVPGSAADDPAAGGSAAGDHGSGVRRAPADPSAAGERIDPVLLGKLGVEPARATLLQFSSAFCAPCRAVRRVSGEVADLLPGVRHVEVDAESHLDAVRALGIWRTPTLLVLDAEGRVVKRATGVPGKAQLIAVLGDLLPAV